MEVDPRGLVQQPDADGPRARIKAHDGGGAVERSAGPAKRRHEAHEAARERRRRLVAGEDAGRGGQQRRPLAEDLEGASEELWRVVEGHRLRAQGCKEIA